MKTIIRRAVPRFLACFGLLALAAITAPQVRAQTPYLLGGWNPNGQSGTNPASPWAATTVGTGVSSNSFVSYGSGVTNSSLANGFAANGWSNSTATNLPSALAVDKFFQFTLAPVTGFEMSLDRVEFIWRTTGTGPQTWQLVYSLDGFASTTNAIASPTSIVGGGTQTNNYSLSLTNISDLQAFTNTVTFRLVGWDSSASTGTAALFNNNTTTNALSIYGVSTSVVTGADYFWTANGTDLGGTGTWDTTGATWSETNSPITPVVWDSTKTAIFAGTAGTVTVDTVSADNGLVFSNTDYTLTGGTLTLGGASAAINSIQTDSGVTTTINTALAGATGFSKTGAGTLILGGANTFSGGIDLAGGTLSVGADSHLGNSANDLAFNGGTLQVTTGFDANSDRDFTGSGTIDIADGEQLEVFGAFNMSAVTLNNTGQLALLGSTRNVGNLTLSAAATISGSAAITAASLDASALTSGTATIVADLIYSSGGDKILEVGDGGRLVIDGTVSGTTGRIVKLGAGTLQLNNTNHTSGVRLGLAGSTTGGTLVLVTPEAAGTNQFQLNHGTLVALTPMTITNDLSFGGREATPLVLGGTQPIEFTGNVGWFTSGTLNTYVVVDNESSFSGVISNVASDLKFVFGGSGVMKMEGSAANTFTNTVVVSNTLTLQLDKDANTTAIGGDVEILSGATLFISSSEQVADTSAVTLSGGTILRGAGASETFGALTLTDDSMLNFGGMIESSFLQFGTVTLNSNLLTVSNFLLGNQLRYLAADFDAGLALANSFDFVSSHDEFGYSFDSGTFTITAIPEPSTLLATIGLAGVLLWPARRRLLKDTKALFGRCRPTRAANGVS